MKHIFSLCVLLLAQQAFAVDWVCSTSARNTKVKVDQVTLQQAYAGQPVLLGKSWLKAVMLPAQHPDTRQAFASLSLSPEAAEKMANGTGLIDRGIRVVRTPDQMLDMVSGNHPAVGFTGFFVGAPHAAICF
jgi:hypothetical protein